jgi:hypothetical protein
MCRWGMNQEDKSGEALVRKRTGFMTNAGEIAKVLEKKCNGDHRHISLEGGNRTKVSEKYPDELCKEVVRGLIRQMRKDKRLGSGGIGVVMKTDEEQGFEDKEEEYDEFWDDLSGEALDPEMVREARKEEMLEFVKHGVYIKVPIQECMRRTGKKPIGVRWVDINKGDKAKPDYRSRLVAKEINTHKREDLFAATPPLEAKKILFSPAVTTGTGYQRGQEMKGMKLDFIDVRRAYFHAKARREVYVDLPEEDAEPGMCGKLVMAMYGTRDAAQNWEIEYGNFMKEIGFAQGRATPCAFHHPGRDLRCVVHGDDFTLLGNESDLDWFRNKISTKYEVKFRGRLGRGPKDDKAIRILNRVVEWDEEGIKYEADQRHAEIIFKDLGLAGGKSVVSP